MVEKKLLSGGVCAGHDGRSGRPKQKMQKVRRTKLQRMGRFSPRIVDKIACRDCGFNPDRKRENQPSFSAIGRRLEVRLDWKRPCSRSVEVGGAWQWAATVR